MRSSLRPVFALLVALATLGIATPARALEPAYTAGRPQVSGGLRYGSDNLDFGVGGRGGYTLDMNLYLGGSVDYFFGDSQGFSDGSRSSYSFWTLSFESGYDFHVADKLVVRPYGGLGVIGVTGEYCRPVFGCTDTDGSDFVFTMGGLLHYFVTDRLHLGPDLRLLIHDDAAVVLGANFGAAF